MFKGIKNLIKLLKINPLVTHCYYCNSLHVDVLRQHTDENKCNSTLKCKDCGAVAEISGEWIK